MEQNLNNTKLLCLPYFHNGIDVMLQVIFWRFLGLQYVLPGVCKESGNPPLSLCCCIFFPLRITYAIDAMCQVMLCQSSGQHWLLHCGLPIHNSVIISNSIKRSLLKMKVMNLMKSRRTSNLCTAVLGIVPKVDEIAVNFFTSIQLWLIISWAE